MKVVKMKTFIYESLVTREMESEVMVCDDGMMGRGIEDEFHPIMPFTHFKDTKIKNSYLIQHHGCVFIEDSQIKNFYISNHFRVNNNRYTWYGDGFKTLSIKMMYLKNCRVAGDFKFLEHGAIIILKDCIIEDASIQVYPGSKLVLNNCTIKNTSIEAENIRELKNETYKDINEFEKVYFFTEEEIVGLQHYIKNRPKNIFNCKHEFIKKNIALEYYLLQGEISKRNL